MRRIIRKLGNEYQYLNEITAPKKRIKIRESKFPLSTSSRIGGEIKIKEIRNPVRKLGGFNRDVRNPKISASIVRKIQPITYVLFTPIFKYERVRNNSLPYIYPVHVSPLKVLNTDKPTLK